MSFGGSMASAENSNSGSGYNVGENTSGGVSIGSSAGGSQGYSKAGSDNSSFNMGDSFNNSMNRSTGQSTNDSQNQSLGSSSGSTSGRSQSAENIWAPQAVGLEGMYDSAERMFNNYQPRSYAEQQNASNMIGNTQQQGNAAWEQGLQGGAFGEGGEAAGYMDRLNQMGQGGEVNSYAQEMRDMVGRDAMTAQDRMMGGMDARAAASGMSGGARHGNAIGAGMTGINDAAMREQANIGFQAEEAARARQMQANQMQGQGYNALDANRNNAMGQSGQMADLNMRGFDPLNARWDVLNNYNAILGDPTKLGSASSANSGSSSSTNSSSGSSSGQSTNDTFGASQGASTSRGGSLGSSFSDSANNSFNNANNMAMNFGVGSQYGENANAGSGSSSNSSLRGGIL